MARPHESAWHRALIFHCQRSMGHNKGKDNAKKTKTRREKAERLKAAKDAAKASK